MKATPRAETVFTGPAEIAPPPVETPAKPVEVPTHPAETSAKAADIAVATAWTQGKITFRATPLSDVVEEFNRYNTRQLVIADPTLKDTKISGVFSSTDADIAAILAGAAEHRCARGAQRNPHLAKVKIQSTNCVVKKNSQ